jgi:branched-chain amino acid transport system substrate-binding protein
VTITTHQTFSPTAVSVTTQLSKIKATNPQALIIWTTGTPLGTVLKGMQELGMSSMPTMTTSGNESSEEMQGLVGELPARFYFSGPPSWWKASTWLGRKNLRCRPSTVR